MKPAVTAVAAAARTCKVQRWEGKSVVAGELAGVLQNSGMRSWAEPGSGLAASRADDLLPAVAASVQLGYQNLKEEVRCG